MINQWTITLIYSISCALIHHSSLREISKDDSKGSRGGSFCRWLIILLFATFGMTEHPDYLDLHVFLSMTMLGAGLIFEFDEYLKEKFEEE